MTPQKGESLEANGANVALKGSFIAVNSTMGLQLIGSLETDGANFALKRSFIAVN